MKHSITGVITSVVASVLNNELVTVSVKCDYHAVKEAKPRQRFATVDVAYGHAKDFIVGNEVVVTITPLFE